ncbi:MAG TPA: MlaD family protein, partial [Tepidisphaeraceae bacterium]|nr:MlaD family protein [Tepidisphaeraceae bacterium]
MPKPYKFRYVNQIAGAFAGFILLILVVGLVLVARAQKWFEPVRHVTVRMPSEGCYGLKAGGDVRIMGAVVGAIDSIEIQPKTGLMVASVHVRPDFAEFIRLGTADVKAIIHVPIGFADPYLEILNAKAFATEVTPKGLVVAEHEADASEAFNRIGKYVDTVGPTVDKL